MKKTLVGLATASLLCAGVAQARFFVGVEGGYTAQHSYQTGLESTSTLNFALPKTSIIYDALKDGSKGYSVGMSIGTEDVGGIFGTRWYLGAGYTSVSKDDQQGVKWSRNYIDASAGFDMILNFYNSGTTSFGIFGGVSADYHYWLNSSDYKEEFFATFSKHILDFSGKAGVSTLLGGHHRMELYAKLPIASLNVSDSKEIVLGGNYSPASVSFGASYKFVF